MAFCLFHLSGSHPGEGEQMLKVRITRMNPDLSFDLH
jgi:hypothetical protein